jgi:hypothetical protein
MSGSLTETEVSQPTQISLGTLRRRRLENRGPRYRTFGWPVRYPEATSLPSQPLRGRVAEKLTTIMHLDVSSDREINAWRSIPLILANVQLVKRITFACEALS